MRNIQTRLLPPLAFVILASMGCREGIYYNPSSGKPDAIVDHGTVFLRPEELQTAEATGDFAIEKSELAAAEYKVESLTCGCAECKLFPAAKGVVAKISFQLRYERGRRTEGAVLAAYDAKGEKVGQKRFLVSADVYPVVSIVPPPPFPSISLLEGEERILPFSIVCYQPKSTEKRSPAVNVRGEGIRCERVGAPVVDVQGNVRKITQAMRLSVRNDGYIKRTAGKSAATGVIRGEVEVSFDRSSQRYPIEWKMQTRVTAEPKSVFLRTGSPSAVIQLASDAEFSIVNAKEENAEGLLVISPLSKTPGKKCTIEIRLNPEAPRSVFHLRLVVTVDCGGAIEKIVIPVSAL